MGYCMLECVNVQCVVSSEYFNLTNVLFTRDCLIERSSIVEDH